MSKKDDWRAVFARAFESLVNKLPVFFGAGLFTQASLLLMAVWIINSNKNEFNGIANILILTVVLLTIVWIIYAILDNVHSKSNQLYSDLKLIADKLSETVFKQPDAPQNTITGRKKKGTDEAQTDTNPSKQKYLPE